MSIEEIKRRLRAEGIPFPEDASEEGIKDVAARAWLPVDEGLVARINDGYIPAGIVREEFAIQIEAGLTKPQAVLCRLSQIYKDAGLEDLTLEKLGLGWRK